MASSQVKLPPGVRAPFEVYVNGVRQELGAAGRPFLAHPQVELGIVLVGDQHLGDVALGREAECDRAVGEGLELGEGRHVGG